MIIGRAGTPSLKWIYMNVFERHLADLSRRTGISIKVYDRLPEGLDPHVYATIERNSAAGWYDAVTDRVCLFRRNLPADESSLDAAVAFQCMREKGFRALLNANTDRFYASILNGYCRGFLLTDLTVSEREIMAEDLLAAIPANDVKEWMKVACRIGEYGGFRADTRLAKALASGLKSYLNNVYRKARFSLDYDVIDRFFKARLTEGSDMKGVSLGRASDAFLRIGYPEGELCVRSLKVRDFLSAEGFLNEGINLTERIQNPLAIIADKAAAMEGKDTRNIIITDHMVKGKGFLSFSVDSSNDVLGGYCEGKSSIFIRSARFMSEYALLSALGSDDGANIQYLSKGRNGGYAVTGFLMKMRDRSFEELGKRNGDGNTPVFSPLSESRRLTHVANIVSNFRNPMRSDKRKEIYGMYLYEDRLERREEMRREMVSSSASIHGYDRQTVEPAARKVSDPKRTYYDSRDFSQSAIRKMQKSRVVSAFDIMTYGKEHFRRDFGPKTFTMAVDFLDRHNLAFMDHVVVRRIDESVLDGLDMEGHSELLRRDMHYAFSSMKEEQLVKDVCMPRGIDGRYFRGAECYCMLAKTYSLARWRDCNVFISRDQAQSQDVSIRSGAVPTYVRENGSVVPYYNLSETSFAVDSSEAFKELKEYMQNASLRVDSYAKAYMCSFLQSNAASRNGTFIYRIDLIDAAFERHFRGPSDLVNGGGVMEKLTSMSERLAAAYIKGKVDGINTVSGKEPEVKREISYDTKSPKVKVRQFGKR